MERDGLVRRMESYFDPAVSDEEMARISPAAMTDTRRFPAAATRERLQQRGLLRENFVRYCYRPFDTRWLYWEPETKLLDEKRPAYFPQVFEGNVWLSAAQQNRKLYDPAYFTNVYTSRHVIERGANLFPLYLRETDSLFAEAELSEAVKPNLSEFSRDYLERTGAEAESLFYHVFAVSHSVTYAEENAGALRFGWPRIPLPESSGALEESAELGRAVAALVNPEVGVAGVTEGRIRAELRTLAVISREGGGGLDPAAGDFAVNAGWGYKNLKGATMPGRTGRAVERAYTPEELEAIEAGAEALGLTPEELLEVFGETTFDVYLNDSAYWKNIPIRVWEYTTGGYRVVKKWLSYREKRVLGRDLSPEEVREVGRIVRRIAATLTLGPRLDANYETLTIPPEEPR